MKSTNIEFSEGNLYATVTFTDDDGAQRIETLNVEDLDSTADDFHDRVAVKAYATKTEVIVDPRRLNIIRNEDGKALSDSKDEIPVDTKLDETPTKV